MHNKFNNFLTQKDKMEKFVELLEFAAYKGISGYNFVKNILRPVLENQNWIDTNQFINIISKKLTNLNETIIDPTDPMKIITRKAFTPEQQEKRKLLHNELFEKVKEELKKHIKNAQYKAGYFLQASEKHDNPKEDAKSNTIRQMLDHLTKNIDNYINNYQLRYKTDLSDKEYGDELSKRAQLRQDFTKESGPIISQFTKEKIPVKHVSFAELLQKTTNIRSRMTDLQKIKLSFTVDQLIKDISVNPAHKAKLKLLAASLPTPPINKADLKEKIEEDQARRRRHIAFGGGTTPSASSEPSAASTSSDPRYNPELDDILGIPSVSVDAALDAVVNAVSEPVQDIKKEVPVAVTPEEPPASLAQPETVNPEPTVVGRDPNRAVKLRRGLTEEEKNYYNSIGRNSHKKARFLDATPEQRREMMASGTTQRDLFSSSGMSDWTNNNIGTFKQFVERF